VPRRPHASHAQVGSAFAPQRGGDSTGGRHDCRRRPRRGPAVAQGHATSSRLNPSTYNFNSPTSAAVVGTDLFVTNGAGNSVTEVNASTGTFMSQISGRHYKFQSPSAIEAVGTDLFVANAGGNSVTEFSASNFKRVHVIRRHNFDLADPVALASSGSDLFILNGRGSVAEVSTTSRKLIGTASGAAFGSTIRPGSPSPTGASSWQIPPATPSR
jgi:hypothetical protein